MWEAYAVMLQLVWQKNVLMAIFPVVMADGSADSHIACGDVCLST